MAEMQNIEAAVGDDQFLAIGTNLPPPRRQIVPSDDFIAEIHGVILPVPRRLATIYRWQKQSGLGEWGDCV
jgi:hypothetical protein